MLMVRMAGALRLAELLDILLDGGKIGLCGIDVAGLQILGKLRDGGRQRIVAWRSGSDGSVLRIAREKLLQGVEVTLRLREIAGLQVLRELLEALLKLVGLAVRSECVELGNDAVGDAENGHACLLYQGLQRTRGRPMGEEASRRPIEEAGKIFVTI